MPAEMDYMDTEPKKEKVSLFSSDVDKERGLALKILVAVAVVLPLLYFSLVALFFGSGYRPEYYWSKLDIWVLDYDSGSISTAFQEFVPYWNSQTLPHVNVKYFNGPTTFPNGLDDIISAVNGGYNNMWGAIVLNAGASDNLTAALTDPAAPFFNSTNVFTIIYDEGRNPAVMDGVILVAMEDIMLEFGFNYSVANTYTLIGLLANQTISQTVIEAIAVNPLAAAYPIYFNNITLNQVPNGSIDGLATSIGVIFSFLFSIISAVAIFFSTNALLPKVHLWQLILMRFTAAFVLSLFLSLLYCADVVIFQGTVARGWGLYWLVMWYSIFGFILTVLSMFWFMPQKILPLLLPLIFFFMFSNVSSAQFFSPLELSEPFYQYGYMFPFRACVEASRTILFGSYDRLYQDLPILGAWIIMPMIVMITVSSIQRV